ncbi:LOW QUALITY PROTEIN: hypothetical protein CVT25_013913 [Psilocybe cyanescens]|uniref:Uncharacterized protein n=1 Tax=Psilocybe cyanescens TaxID=93625 RepID=A0A409XRN3_PSICY|nr:LOW QUALITY PROTEIN: hypothetical protein CVT25_013913 [Psilocybe cyanescens]
MDIFITPIGDGGQGSQGGSVTDAGSPSDTNTTPTPVVGRGHRKDNKGHTSKLSPNPAVQLSNPTPNSNPKSTNPPKLTCSALNLLSLRKPRISTMLGGDKGVLVLLEVLDVLKSVRMSGPVSNIQHHPLSGGGMGVGVGVGGGRVDVKGGSGGVESKQRQEEAEKEAEKIGKRERVGAGVLYIGLRDMKAQAGAGVGAKSISEEEWENNEYGERRKLMEICSTSPL